MLRAADVARVTAGMRNSGRDEYADDRRCQRWTLVQRREVGWMLEDVRVTEVAMLAPSALGMHLGDLGADVIKVEDPALGDYVREIGRAPAEEASLSIGTGTEASAV